MGELTRSSRGAISGEGGGVMILVPPPLFYYKKYWLLGFRVFKLIQRHLVGEDGCIISYLNY